MTEMQKPYFIHIRTEFPGINSHGGITIAVLWAPELDCFVFETAQCHTSENYNKKIGRAIATGRLRKNGGIPLDHEIRTVKDAEQRLRRFYGHYI
jgi:hypothetical protein